MAYDILLFKIILLRVGYNYIITFINKSVSFVTDCVLLDTFMGSISVHYVYEIGAHRAMQKVFKYILSCPWCQNWQKNERTVCSFVYLIAQQAGRQACEQAGKRAGGWEEEDERGVRWTGDQAGKKAAVRQSDLFVRSSGSLVRLFVRIPHNLLFVCSFICSLIPSFI